jgi:hypothetical protein
MEDREKSSTFASQNDGEVGGAPCCEPCKQVTRVRIRADVGHLGRRIVGKQQQPVRRAAVRGENVAVARRDPVGVEFHPRHSALGET